MKVGTFLCGGLSALAILTRDIWALLILIPLALYLYKNKTKDKKEREELEALTYHSFAFFLILPAAIILIFFDYLIIWKVGQAIIQNFNP